MTNRTFYILVAAAVALLAYAVWASLQLKATKKDNQILENDLTYLSDSNRFLSTQNDELLAENQNFRRHFNQ